jgi:hypothetical protein
MGWSGRAPAHQQAMLVRGTKDKAPGMAEALKNSIAFVGIDIGKRSTTLVSMSAAQSCCGRSGPVAMWKHGSRICRHA